MRRELDELSVDIGLIFPDHLLLIAQLPNEHYAAALARAYNRWLVSEWLEERGLYGAVVATPQDPAEAAGEISRYATHERVAAVYLPTSAVYPLWGHRCYDPIFAAAQEADLPVVLHSVTAVSPRFPFNVEQFDSHAAKHVVGHSFAMMANLVDMITTGVPARFPDLRIAFAEAGVSWVPFLMWRLDKEFAEVRREMPHLEDRPSTYIKRMYFATQPIEEPDDRKQLAQMIEMIGHEQVLFASDWPHHDFDHPRAVLDLPLDHRVKENILGMNAVQLFRLPGPVSG
jgi:predicted TIM-barrel fold metal-dependent hydrolase